MNVYHVGHRMLRVRTSSRAMLAIYIAFHTCRASSDHGLGKHTIMSDSEDSTITYTDVSSPFADLLDIRSRGVDGPPVMLEDPYAYVSALSDSLPPEDEVLPAEDQPLPTAASPTPDSPGYVPESDPEEDLEENDDEDLKEDPTDEGEDGDDEDESSDDDKDDDVDIDIEEEEEHHHFQPNSTTLLYQLLISPHLLGD
ncbi:hypothetical protein Tco_1081320 [Tanacetum coccineum]|uniref:Uncharacterized protein n=1 Tax=Tanacetum coccineum TaxID=301880 RepID=A0ABQ5HYQ8_9ASTR